MATAMWHCSNLISELTQVRRVKTLHFTSKGFRDQTIDEDKDPSPCHWCKLHSAFQLSSMHAKLHTAECIESKGNPLLVFVVDFSQYQNSVYITEAIINIFLL